MVGSQYLDQGLGVYYTKIHIRVLRGCLSFCSTPLKLNLSLWKRNPAKDESSSETPNKNLPEQARFRSAACKKRDPMTIVAMQTWERFSIQVRSSVPFIELQGRVSCPKFKSQDPKFRSRSL